MNELVGVLILFGVLFLSFLLFNITIPFIIFAKNNFKCPACGHEFKTKRGLLISLFICGRHVYWGRFKCLKCKFRK